MSILCKVFDNKLCPELTCLRLGGNKITDEGLSKLCKRITRQNLLKLTTLNLWECSLTNECVPVLSELLRNECCNLIDSSLDGNPGINDKGLRILCEDALTKEHCKLVELNLGYCSLTNECIPDLCKTLQDDHCRISTLRLDGNVFADEGKSPLVK